ncbi:MAG: hypothetical protein ABR530_07335 [Pyrinomonadaceae bacterium]
MKRCPKCRRDYSDETMNFCLEDGSRLVSASGSENPTVFLAGDSAENNSVDAVHQDIRFCTAADGVRLAYSVLARGHCWSGCSDTLHTLRWNGSGPITGHATPEAMDETCSGK